jgi:hypothetical protein
VHGINNTIGIKSLEPHQSPFIINPYRFAGATEFDSMYESFNPLTTVNKQHFVDWFTGKQLSSIWTTHDISGAGTFEMADDVDGGFKIITNTGSTAKNSINFGDIRQYSPTASEVIFIAKRITDSGINGQWNIGLSYGNSNYPSHSIVVTNYPADTYYSLSSTASSGVSRSSNTGTSTPVDTAWHSHRLTNGSSDLKLTIDGVLEVTRTAHRPIHNMQPLVQVYSVSLASEMRIRYFEAYNT